jgi:hypothetical protein
MLDCPLEKVRKAADLGIQEIHLAGLVISNRQKGHLAFFHMENQIQSKYHQECKRMIHLKHLCSCNYTTYLLFPSHQSMQKIKDSYAYNISEISKNGSCKNNRANR